MFSIFLSKLAKIVDGVLVGKNLEIKSISIDTRDIYIKNSIFIAIKGKNIDSHFLCFEALNKGALALLVDFFYPTISPQLIVKDTKLSLFKIVRWIRLNSKAKILALTGSTGKTSIKEITVNILKKCGKTLYTYKNLNNHLGISITLLKLFHKIYDYVVLEVGLDKVSDIDEIGYIICPDIALVNNICLSHLTSFKNFKNIIYTKGKIFNFVSNSGIIIININSNYLYLWRKFILDRKVIFFSCEKELNSNIYASNINITVKGSNFILHTPLGKFEVFLKLLGIHNIFNVLASVSLVITLNISITDILSGIESFTPIRGRLYPIYLNKYQLILDDTYNSNPRSVFYSLKFFQECKGYRVLVIGDMGELDYMSLYFHMKIGCLVRNMFIDKVLSLGKYSLLISKYSLKGLHFFSFNNLVLELKKILFFYKKVSILIKGSHFLRMERIIKFL